MLGSEQAGERNAAARAIERLRRKIGWTWVALLWPARATPAIIVPPWSMNMPILAQGEGCGRFTLTL
jgi:hypothetical protein